MKKRLLLAVSIFPASALLFVWIGFASESLQMSFGPEKTIAMALLFAIISAYSIALFVLTVKKMDTPT